MRPLSEQTVLVTGATDGLGRALAEDLAAAGATVLVHGRDDERGARTVREITAATGNRDVRWYRADLSELAQVAALADRVARDHPRLDVLVANAGIGGGERETSRDGYELRFAVNYLACYLLTRRLLPAVRAAAAAAGSARIVLVSSAGQQALDLDDVMMERGYTGLRAYCQSKLAQIMLAIDLAAELDGTGVVVNALHPSTHMATKMVPHPVTTVAAGVAAARALVVDPEWEHRSGRYVNVDHEDRAEAQAYDADARRRLAGISRELCAPYLDPEES